MKEFADSMNISYDTVKKNAQRGNIIKGTKGKIDTDNPTNKLFFDKQMVQNSVNVPKEKKAPTKKGTIKAEKVVEKAAEVVAETTETVEATAEEAVEAAAEVVAEKPAKKTRIEKVAAPAVTDSEEGSDDDEDDVELPVFDTVEAGGDTLDG